MAVIHRPRSVPRAYLAPVAALAIALATGSAAGQTSVRLSLDEPLEGQATPFFVAQDKGYFRNAGLDVSIETDANALDPITRVATGGDELGFADLNALIRYRDRNPAAPVRAIFMVYNKPPFAVVGRKSRGITDPKSLEGKALGAPSASASFQQWPIFAGLNNVDRSKVAIEAIGAPVRAPMLAAGQLDAVLGASFRVYVDLKDRGVPLDDIALLPMPDYGLRLYGGAIIVNSKFMAEKPTAVTAFLTAFTRGLQDAIRNPSAAVDSVLQRAELDRKEVELERLQMVIRENIVTPEARANGLGAIDSTRLAEAIDQIETTTHLKSKPRAEAIFDPEFLPPATDRMIP